MRNSRIRYLGAYLGLIGAVGSFSPLVTRAFAAVDNLPSDSYDDYDEAKYQSQASDSRARYDQARGALDQAEQILQGARSRELQTRNQLDDINRSIENFRAEDMRASQRLEQNKAEAQAIVNAIQGLNANLDGVRRDIEGTRGMIQRQNDFLAKATDENKRNEAQLDTLTKINQTAKADFEAKKSASDANLKAIENAKNSITQAQAGVSDAVAAKSTTETEIASLESQKASLSNDIAVKQNYQKSLQAQLADIESQLESLKADLAKAQGEGRADDATAIQAKITDKQSSRNSVKTELANVAQAIAGPQAQLAAVEKSLAADRQKVADLTQRIANLQAQIQKARDDQSAREANQPALASAQANSEKSLNETMTALKTQTEVTNESRKRVAEIQGRLNEAKNRLAELERANQDLGRQLAAANGDYNRHVEEARALTDRITYLRNELGRLASARQATSDALVRAEAETRGRTMDRDSAANGLRLADEDLQRRLGRLREVQNYIAQADRRMIEVAGADGSADGEREGREFGTAQGMTDGTSNGNAKGKEDGTAEGKLRDYQSGYAIGQARGIDIGKKDANANGETNGKKDGTAQGTTAGLQVAYDTGKAKGLEYGAQTGADKAAYGKGYTRGDNDGLNAARTEAQAQEPIGYNDREKEYRSAPLKEVVLGEGPDAALVKGFAGLQGAAGAKNGDGRYYNPRPKNYPHPVIKSFYLRHYDESYRSTLDRVYTDTYQVNYAKAYRTSYEAARADALAQSYPNDKAQGDKDAYAKFYKQTYDATYPGAYEARRSYYYGVAFDIAKKDEATTKRGFDDGNAIASEDKGYREGRDHGYTTNLGPEKTAAYERGRASANKKYTENPVLEVVDSIVVDGNADSIFRPGEDVFTELRIKNYGLQPKAGLITRVQVQGPVTAQAPEGAVVQIPAQSVARVRGLSRATISAQAAENAGISVGFQLLDTNRSVLHQKVSNLAIRYPVGAQVAGFDGVLVPGTPNKMQIQLSNRSSKPQNLLVSINLDSSKVDADTTQSVANVAPGATASVTFTLTGKPEANFEAVPVQVAVTQGGDNYVKPFNVSTVVIRRHQADPNSIGMMLSADLSKANERFFYAVGGLDTWDLRVDGSINEAKALDPYVGKIIHLILSDNLALDAPTMASLQAYLAKGGVITVWGTSLDNKLPQLGGLLGLSSARSFTAGGALNGSNFLSGLKADISGQAAALTITDRKAVPVLSVGGDTIGAMDHTGEFTGATGRVITLAVDPQALSKDEILAIFGKLELVKLPFDKKLELASKDVSKLSLVLDEIKEEILDDDLRTDVTWFKSNKKATKAYQAVQTFLLKGNGARDEFIKRFPEVFTVYKAMNDSTDRGFVNTVLESTYVGSFFGKDSWKGFYCKTYDPNNSSEACR